jgi:hypothetical protein
MRQVFGQLAEKLFLFTIGGTFADERAIYSVLRSFL